MPTPKLIAKFETSLSAGIDYSATSMVLSSIVTKNPGVNVPAGVYGFTIDEGTSDEEYLIGTCDGATGTITALGRGLSYIDGETLIPANAKAHRKGAQVKITDHPALIAMYNRSSAWMGVYNPLTDYSQRDIVEHNGSSYVARVDPPAGTAPTNTAYWDVMAAKGQDGLYALTGQEFEDSSTISYNPDGTILTVTDLTTGGYYTFTYTNGVVSSYTNGTNTWTLTYTAGNITGITKS